MAALAQLPQGSYIFYPAIQDAEIEPVLKTTAKTRGVYLFPVDTVEEAVHMLLDAMGVSRRTAWYRQLTPYRWPIGLGLAAVAVLAALWVYPVGLTLPVTDEKPISRLPTVVGQNALGSTLDRIREFLTQGHIEEHCT